MQQRFTKSNLTCCSSSVCHYLDAKQMEKPRIRLSDVPSVDRIYPAEETIIHHNGKYKDGFLNAMVSAKNVTQTTKGYNYGSSVSTSISQVMSANAMRVIPFRKYANRRNHWHSLLRDRRISSESAEGAVQRNPKAPSQLINFNDKPLHQV